MPEAFVHESWTVEDGLPVNSVNALLQSRDGYLWIATYDGLVRFDGVRFTVFNSSNSEGLPSNRVVQPHEARDGALWMRTTPNPLVRFRDGVFTHFGAEHGVADRVWTLFEDRDGTLWVGTEQGLGFIRDELLVPIAPETIRGRGRRSRDPVADPGRSACSAAWPRWWRADQRVGALPTSSPTRCRRGGLRAMDESFEKRVRSSGQRMVGAEGQ